MSPLFEKKSPRGDDQRCCDGNGTLESHSPLIETLSRVVHSLIHVACLLQKESTQLAGTGSGYFELLRQSWFWVFEVFRFAQRKYDPLPNVGLPPIGEVVAHAAAYPPGDRRE